MKETSKTPHLQATDLKLGYGSNIVQSDLSFDVNQGDIFVLLGGSGCGKSTVMRGLIGLLKPQAGSVHFNSQDIWLLPEDERSALMQRFGVSYQQGALWSSMTCLENVSLPLEQHTNLTPVEIVKVASYKLSLVGLGGFEDYFPSEISGGMKKRVGVARAMALDPEILFFDEPSAGLDPLSARLLDELLLELRDSLGTTMVLVTHELASIFSIADDCVFLDNVTKTMLTTGNPAYLRDHSDIAKVRSFLNRGEI